jgi:hypothetical protein
LERADGAVNDPESTARVVVCAAEAGIPVVATAAEAARPTEARAAQDRADVMKLLLDGANVRQVLFP